MDGKPLKRFKQMECFSLIHMVRSLLLSCVEKVERKKEGGTGRVSLDPGCFKTLAVPQMKPETGPCLKRARRDWGKGGPLHIKRQQV